ncbi:unnamed protein product [Allacma fusca]|uniref:Uncharacterized protein n=1 Tax=Allacma fusca TaxID=39272 RepID=A0A8J2PKV0_9HEXA|nr:unnamed protein product [Allacma fusca]
MTKHACIGFSNSDINAKYGSIAKYYSKNRFNTMGPNIQCSFLNDCYSSVSMENIYVKLANLTTCCVQSLFHLDANFISVVMETKDCLPIDDALGFHWPKAVWLIVTFVGIIIYIGVFRRDIERFVEILVHRFLNMYRSIRLEESLTMNLQENIEMEPVSLQEVVDECRSLFNQKFGNDPSIVVKAPGRVNMLTTTMNSYFLCILVEDNNFGIADSIPGFDAAIVTTVPLGEGLSSSGQS